MDEKEVLMLLDADTQELYIRIGRELTGKNIFPLGDEKLMELSRKWFVDLRSKLKSIVCSNERVQSIFLNQSNIQQRISLVFALADLISSLTMNVSPWSVSALLVKEGIDTLCKDIWSSHNG